MVKWSSIQFSIDGSKYLINESEFCLKPVFTMSLWVTKYRHKCANKRGLNTFLSHFLKCFVDACYLLTGL